MAKLVDALPSGGSVRKDVLVRIQSRAQSFFISLDSIDFHGLFVFPGCYMVHENMAHRELSVLILAIYLTNIADVIIQLLFSNFKVINLRGLKIKP